MLKAIYTRNTESLQVGQCGRMSLFYSVSNVNDCITLTVGEWELEKVVQATQNEEYKQRALHYAERYGKVEYTVKGKWMMYKVSYYGEHSTFKVVVDLDTQKEQHRTQTARYNKKYEYNA